jgi:beta-lactamase class A
VIAVPPPAVIAPASVVFGHVAVRIGRDTRRVEVWADGRRRSSQRVRSGPRRVSVRLPTGRWQIVIRALGGGGTSRSASRIMWVLPTSGARAGTTDGRVDARLERDLEALAEGFPAFSGIYAQHLISGCGAAVNAAAPFPAASTLKAAILLDAVRRPSGASAGLLDQMVLDSSDRAANDVLGIQGGGDGVSGAARVTETLRAIGLTEALVRRPYILDDDAKRGGPIPLDATTRPALYTNFLASPVEMARLMISLHRGALGIGRVRALGIRTPIVREQITRRLLDVRDRTKLVAGLPAGMPIAHKTGYTTEVKHDVGVAYTASGPVVIAVMTWGASGVSDALGDPFIAAVGRSVIARLADGGRCR